MSIDTTKPTEDAGSKFTLTYDEFDRMVERGAFDHLQRKIELIRGELTQMNPAGPLDNDLIMFLISWSGRAMDHATTQVTAQTGLNLSEFDSRPEPDLMWLRKARYQTSHPRSSDVRLAIEVSYSSLKTDLNQKAELYAEAGITEYWIVDAVALCVHVFLKPDGERYTERRIANCGDSLFPQCQPEAALDIAELFGK